MHILIIVELETSRLISMYLFFSQVHRVLYQKDILGHISTFSVLLCSALVHLGT